MLDAPYRTVDERKAAVLSGDWTLEDWTDSDSPMRGCVLRRSDHSGSKLMIWTQNAVLGLALLDLIRQRQSGTASSTITARACSEEKEPIV